MKSISFANILFPFSSPKVFIKAYKICASIFFIVFPFYNYKEIKNILMFKLKGI